MMVVSERDDNGVTLVELIVFIVVAGLFGSLLVLMFVNGISEQSRSTVRDDATGKANVISVSLSHLRNATHATASPDGTALIATIVSRTGVESCYGWSIPGDGTVRYLADSSTPIRFADVAGGGVLVEVDADNGDVLTGDFTSTGDSVLADISITSRDETSGAVTTVPLSLTIPTQAILETEAMSQCVSP